MLAHARVKIMYGHLQWQENVTVLLIFEILTTANGTHTRMQYCYIYDQKYD